MSQEHDPAFDVVPQGNSFFFIWRVKQFELVPVPKEDYGKFYKGDCYIVFCCSDEPTGGHSGMESKPLKTSHGYTRIHFWIGSESSQDEAGVAAIKSVELDDYLGGYPVQHREIEGVESQQFLSYFRNGIRLLKGGFESGFHHVHDEIQPALFQIKGKKRPIMLEMYEISWKEVNNGDVFILVTPKYIFVWTGAKSNRMERHAAIRIANELKTEFSRFHLSIVVLDDGQEVEQLSGDEHAQFDQFLPLDKKDGEIQHFSEEFDWIASDEKFEKGERGAIQLYRCQETSDQIDIKWVKEGPLKRSDLDSNDTFIVANGFDGIWVWVGKNATKGERSSALKYAIELIKKKDYSAKTEVTKVIEGGESVEFRSLFGEWKLESEHVPHHARLFRLLRNGNFAQVVQFEKADLEEDSIMLLDALDVIYVWISSHFAESLSDPSQLDRVAKRYLAQDKSGRQVSQIVKVRQGEEDNKFKSYFKQWD